MSNEAGNDDKVKVTLNFTTPSSTIWGDKLVMSPVPDWATAVMRQRFGRITREGQFLNVEAAPSAVPIMDCTEGDDNVHRLLNSWLENLKTIEPPKMELSPEILKTVLESSGVDLSGYKITDIQCTADPHVINITLE